MGDRPYRDEATGVSAMDAVCLPTATGIASTPVRDGTMGSITMEAHDWAAVRTRGSENK
jgi:hypothetical protein